MKKLLLVLVVLSSCTLAFAQGEVGKWSVHVQLGVNMNNWGVKNSSGNMTFDWTDAIANIDRVETKSKLGLVGGAEIGQNSRAAAVGDRELVVNRSLALGACRKGDAYAVVLGRLHIGGE